MKRRNPYWILALGLGFLVARISMAPGSPAPVFEPQRDANYTSSREIERLEFGSDGTLWAKTSGGTLRFQDQKWRRFIASPHQWKAPTPLIWRGQTVVATFDGLRVGSGKTAKIVPLPPSSGSHISALLPRGDSVWAALFGNGIWAWNGRIWSQPRLNLPLQAREITALGADKNGAIWLGTRRAGLWKRQNGVWKGYLQPDEPFAHNVQFLLRFGGALWASTLEDGLVVRDSQGWKHFGAGELSSNAPRQMAQFGGRLYVRHSNERVDCYDGKTWSKNVFPRLPRRQIIALAADEKRLYLGQWGGWSEWDGHNFTHHLTIPDLQIVPLLQLFPDGQKLWLGTENRGLFEWNFAIQKLKHFDERDGLPDDWISALGRSERAVLAGTFGGGLAWKTDSETKWHSDAKLKRIGITSIATDAQKRTYIGTRFGLYRRESNGDLELQDGFEPSQREVQALLMARGGVWIGTRNGLLFRAHRQ